MRRFSEDLKPGDVLAMPWCGAKTIAGFEDHGGLPFIDRIAVFTDGTSMALEKGLDYEILTKEGAIA